MIRVEINLLTNNIVLPFQNLREDYIKQVICIKITSRSWFWFFN